MGDRQARPEQQLVGAGRQLGRAAVQRAGLVGAARRPSARRRRRPARRRARARAAARARRAGRRGPRRAGRRARATPRPPAGTTSSAADWRPRTSPPSPCAACSAASSRAARSPVAASNAADIAAGHGVALHHVRLAAPRRAGRVAGVRRCSPGRWRPPRRRARRRSRPGARGAARRRRAAPSSASARGLAAPPSGRARSGRARARPPTAWRPRPRPGAPRCTASRR